LSGIRLGEYHVTIDILANKLRPTVYLRYKCTRSDFAREKTDFATLKSDFARPKSDLATQKDDLATKMKNK
jgi:hypothetical protein